MDTENAGSLDVQQRITALQQRFDFIEKGIITLEEQLEPGEKQQPICWQIAEDNRGHEYIQFSDQGRIVTYRSNAPDWWNVSSNMSFSSGIHFVEIVVHKIGDEGWFGVTSKPNEMFGNQQVNPRHKNGVFYYVGRRHKQGDLFDGCASLINEGKPQRRMFHIADGNVVGMLIDCEKHKIMFFASKNTDSPRLYQGQAPIPPEPVWVLGKLDYTDDCFEIRTNSIPQYVPWYQDLYSSFVASLVSKEVTRGDVVYLNGRPSTVHYGPDFQGDMQLMFNAIYPDYFPISGDVNEKDPGVHTGRHITRRVIMSCILCIIVCQVCFVWGCLEAYHATQLLSSHVRFKATIIFFILSLSGGLCLALMKAPDAIWKKRFLRILETVPPGLTFISIMSIGPEEEDLECTKEHWGPMIPMIAKLYSSQGINATDLRRNIGFVAFNPFMQIPSLQIPTMERSIEAEDLTQRNAYYISEILGLVFVTCLVIELIRKVLTVCLRPVQATKTFLGQPLLQQSHATHAYHRPTFWYGTVFALWYVAYQAFMYVIMDIMVMCGAVNLKTGPAWEFWVVFVQFICGTHFFCALVRYLSNIGFQQKSATFMIITTLSPFFGNEVHIFKDHVAGAICFAVAHCAEGDVRLAALTLAYLSLFATFVPIAFLFAHETARDGVRKAHWPILESSEPEAGKHEKLQFERDRMVVLTGEYSEMQSEPHVSHHEVACEQLSDLTEDWLESNFSPFMMKVQPVEEPSWTVIDSSGQKLEFTIAEMSSIVHKNAKLMSSSEYNADEDSSDESIVFDSCYTGSLTQDLTPPLRVQINVVERDVPVYKPTDWSAIKIGALVEELQVLASDGNNDRSKRLAWRVKLTDELQVLAGVEQMQLCAESKFSEAPTLNFQAKLAYFKLKHFAMSNVQYLINTIIPSVTQEKQMRAFLGELPHGILHVSFVFYFGGSTFIISAIALSGFKVLAIPVIREQFLPDLIKRYGCSLTKLRLYRASTPHIYLWSRSPASVLNHIEKFSWQQLKEDLIAVGMPAEKDVKVEDALVAAASTGSGKLLKDALNAVGQETDYMLVDAVLRGDCDAVASLAKCGFDLFGVYCHEYIDRGRPATLERFIGEAHADTNGKGERVFNDTGKKLLKILGRNVEEKHDIR